MVSARWFTCASQLGLSRSVTRLFTEEEFEEKWIALGSEQQEKYLLNAFKSQAAGLSDALSMHGYVRLNCLLRMDILMNCWRTMMYRPQNHSLPRTSGSTISLDRMKHIIIIINLPGWGYDGSFEQIE